jgi:hypothetical protein
MVNKIDLRSKLIDGLLAGGILVLLDILLILLMKPIQLIFSRPGILVYTVCLLALSVICLEQSLTNRNGDLVRSWWGTIGGMVAWVVVELSSSLGGQSLLSETAILSLMFVFLVVSIIWRRIAPLGLQYYSLLLLLSWVSQVVLEGMIFLGRYQPLMSSSFTAVGFLAAVVLPGAFVYNFLRTHTRLERLNTAIVMWCAAMILIFVFRGGY